MSVNGISTAATLLQSALSTSGSGDASKTTESFGGLLSDALASMRGTGEASYEETYDMYTELIEQSSDSTEPILAALMSAGMSTSPMMLISLCNALTGETSMPHTDIPSLVSGTVDINKPGNGNVSVSPWKPTDPAIKSDVYNRSAALYSKVIGQFKVGTNSRYAVNQQGKGDTYCNIFVWDVTSAMGAEIPHYYNAKTGEPMEYGDAGAYQMTANRMNTWLHEYGEEYGWYEVSAEEAQALANQGRPVVTSLYRSGTHGHVQVVCPSKDGEYNEDRGVTIAQAGRNLTSYTYITNIYNASLPKVSYFAHM